MKRFKPFISESVVDIPRKTFAKEIFDFADTNKPKLKDKVKQIIDTDLDVLRNIAPIKKCHLIGSILTKRYRSDADLDVNVLFDVRRKNSETVHNQLKSKLKNLNGKKVLGTDYVINYYVLVSDEKFEQADDMSDAVLDVETNILIKSSKDAPFDLEKYMNDFKNSVETLDIIKGELTRDLIDFEELKNLSSKDVDNLNKHLNQKVQELEIDINKLLDIYITSKKDREIVFHKPLTPKEIQQYGSQNRMPKNVVYKMLEKYYYWDLITRLKDIIGKDKKLSKKEAEKLKNIEI